MTNKRELVCVVDAESAEKKIQPLLDSGWKVKMINCQSVSATTDSRSWARTDKGLIIFILESWKNT